MKKLDIDLIKNKLNNSNPYISGWQNMKRAAVIIPLVEIDGEVNVLFEVRAKRLNSQPGDVCFPGGKIDGNELSKEAALREIYEELGLKNVDIISELDLLIRHDGMIIHPFLAIVKDEERITINEQEVDHIFYVPVSYFIENKPLEVINRLKIERSENFPYHLINQGKNYKFKEGTYKSLFYQYNQYVIWGITAQILSNFILRIY